jgi:hypothetical protein
MKTLFSSPGIENVWQIHFSRLGGQEYTVPGMFIANGFDEPLTALPVQPIADPGLSAPPPPDHNGPAFWIKVSAQQDGTFTVTNAQRICQAPRSAANCKGRKIGGNRRQ